MKKQLVSVLIQDRYITEDVTVGVSDGRDIIPFKIKKIIHRLSDYYYIISDFSEKYELTIPAIEIDIYDGMDFERFVASCSYDMEGNYLKRRKK